MEIYLDVKHCCFIFQRVVEIHFSFYSWSDRLRDSTPAIVVSTVETTGRPGRSSSTTLSRPRAEFLQQTYISGLRKHVSPYSGRTLD